MTENNKQKDGINEGTKAKASLQLRAIEFLKVYPCSKTLDSYARLLCWDLNICYRTCLDSYIMPMYEHGYFIYEGNDKFTFCNGRNNVKIKKGRIEKNIIENKEESISEYAKKNPNQKEKEKLKSD